MKVPKKPAPPPTTDGPHRHSPSNRRGGAPSTVAQKPLRDRLLHLLALKPYRKPELLLWLDRERASLRDKADLGSVLEEVRHRHAGYCRTGPLIWGYPLCEENHCVESSGWMD